MPKYRVEITETLQYQEVISAKNEHEALEKLKKKYHNEDIVLGQENHTNTEFSIIEKIRGYDEQSR